MIGWITGIVVWLGMGIYWQLTWPGGVRWDSIFWLAILTSGALGLIDGAVRTITTAIKPARLPEPHSGIGLPADWRARCGTGEESV